jgi:hypothetical protein
MLVRAKSSHHQVMDAMDALGLSVEELYCHAPQVSKGELDDQQVMSIILKQSLEYAEDQVGHGEPLKDWEYMSLVGDPVGKTVMCLQNAPCFRSCLHNKHHQIKASAETERIEGCLAFMAAHRWAQKVFMKEFESADRELNEAGQVVLKESRYQYAKATEVLNKFDRKIVQSVVSHKFCTILLTNGVHYIEELVRIGLLKEDEAEHLVEEIEEELDEIMSCKAESHNMEMQEDTEMMMQDDNKSDDVDETDPGSILQAENHVLFGSTAREM